jgi:hypothetical protein
MQKLFNVYCDESCHLENDQEKVMTLGALWCPTEITKDMFSGIRAIKTKHGFPTSFEVKWTKVSKAKTDFYLDLLKMFFDEKGLHFRAVVIKDKDSLEHEKFDGQDHNVWYYKMFFVLLNALLDPSAGYKIYLDKKDTRSGEKIKKLHDVLCNSKYDFSKDIIQVVQSVHSQEIELLQLADLLIGAVGYANKGLDTNSGKVELVKYIGSRSGYSLKANTLLKEEKLNLFFWTPRKGVSHDE